MPPAHRRSILLVLAIVCFVIAFCLAVGLFSGSHQMAWVDAGLALFAAGHLWP